MPNEDERIAPQPRHSSGTGLVVGAVLVAMASVAATAGLLLGSPDARIRMASLWDGDDSIRAISAISDPMPDAPDGAPHPLIETADKGRDANLVTGSIRGGADGAELGAPPLTEPANSLPSLGQFGADLGVGANFAGLRDIWHATAKAHPDATRGLQPIIAVREVGAAIELHLVVGPLPNAADASALCIALAAPPSACRTAPYDGQTLSP